MNKISETGIEKYISEAILAFLNNVKNSKEIVSLGTTDDYDIGEIVAQRILDRRKELKGGFTDISQLEDIKGFGADKLNDLVNVFKQKTDIDIEYTKLTEPLFRFASLRHHKPKATILTRKSTNEVASEKLENSTSIKVPKRLSQSEINDLEKVHIAALAKGQVTFLNELSHHLKALHETYILDKQKATQKATKEHNKIIDENIKDYEAGLSKEARESLEKLKQDNGSEEVEKYEYPATVIPSFEFQYHAFSSKEYISKKLNKKQLNFLEESNLFNTDYFVINEKIQAETQKKQNIAAYSGLSFKKTFAIKGTPVTIKNRYANGYVLSIDQQNKSVLLSVVAPSKKRYLNNAAVSISIEEKSTEAATVKLIDNDSRVMFIEATFKEMPDVKSHNAFSYNIQLELDNGKQVSVEEKVSGLNSIWTGNYNSDVANVSRDIKQSSATIDPEENISGVIQIGWADLMRVEQTFCCYVPGEISHIENIMAREYKERSTEFLERSEATYVEEQETETNEKTDTSTSEKNDWNKEIQKTIDRNFNLNVGTQVSYGTENGPWYAAINADMSLSNSSSQTTNNAQRFSKEITQSASESIRTKISKKQTTTLIKEFKEQNKHGFDNRNGSDHVSGVFRWLDKVYTNKIINYGKGMLYEFMIPKPSELYVDTLDKTDDTKPDKPEAPKPLRITSGELTRENFMGFITEYGVTNFEEPKKEFSNYMFETSEINSEFEAGNKNKSTAERTFTFPSSPIDFLTEYRLVELNNASYYGYHYDHPGPFYNPQATFKIHIVGTSGTGSRRLLVGIGSSDMRGAHRFKDGNFGATGLNITNGFKIEIEGRQVKRVTNIVLHARFQLNIGVFTAWQDATFTTIETAYLEQVDAYNQALLDYQAQIDADTDASLYDADQKHPAAYKQIIDTELKRLCIELLLQNSSFSRCADFYTTSPKCNSTEECQEDIPMITSHLKLDEYASMVKFLEQCFHWPLSSYNMYPYYWASKCDWADMLHNEDTTDNEFQKFLKSGMARVMVPVREGFEEAVAYFMVTGKPWFGEEPPKLDDALYVSVVTELKKPLGTQVGESWETNVPSTLTLLQAGSTYLDQQGLPCCKEHKGKTGVGWNKDVLLEGKDDPVSTDDSGTNSGGN